MITGFVTNGLINMETWSRLTREHSVVTALGIERKCSSSVTLDKN